MFVFIRVDVLGDGSDPRPRVKGAESANYGHMPARAKRRRVTWRWKLMAVLVTIMTAAGMLTSTTPAHADQAGINWTSRTSAADNSWNSVTYGAGKFVAVASTGSNQVMTSTDGTTWTSRSQAVARQWRSVAYGGASGSEKFVAVAYDGVGNRVMTSTDGITWTGRTSAADNPWFSVAYGGASGSEKFVAVASSGVGNRVMTSTDGITWTARSSAADNQWASVAYGNGLFVAVAISGTGNRVMTSPNGITWTARSSAADNNWRSVAYGNGLFVAVAISGTGNRVMTSPNGITWTSRSSAADKDWGSVAYGDGKFVAVAYSGVAAGNRVMTSQTTYGVTYAGNGSTGGSVPSDVGAYGVGASVTVASNSGVLVRSGYSFAGWNTLADGSGSSYAASSSLTMGSSSVTLYARWSTYSVTYGGNGSSAGSVPIDAGGYVSGASVTVASNTGALVRTGYTFGGWNSAADGSGTSYAASSSFAMGSSSVTLYAQWTGLSYAVAYDANTSTGGSVPSSGSYTSGGAGYPAAANTGTLVRTGYTFAGWNTTADGTGTAYAVGASYSTSSAATLYAQWTAVGTYAISFAANGSTGGSVPASGSYTPGGASYTVAGNTGSLVKAGYTFSGWNTVADGSGTAYAAAASYAVSASATLHAQWSVASYVITFDGNGSTSGSVPTAGAYTTGGVAYSVPGNTGLLVRPGYDFVSWNAAADGSGVAHDAASSYSPTVSATLYAKWTSTPPVPASSSGSGGSSSAAATVATVATVTPVTSVAIAAASWGLKPTSHQVNSNIPVAGVPAGGYVTLVAGAPVTVTVRPNVTIAPTALVVAGSGFTMQVEGRGSAVDKPTVTDKGALVIYSAQTPTRSSFLRFGLRTSPWKFNAPRAATVATSPVALASGTGFLPGSTVHFYILPLTSMGELTVNASGNFSGEVPVPTGIELGDQTLQINGYDPDGAVRSLSLGVVVKASQTTVIASQARTNVLFPANSSKLTEAGKAKLLSLVTRTGKAGVVSVVGFARGPKLRPQMTALSDARARIVSSYLRSLGVTGAHTIRGVWVVGGRPSTGRQVSISISYVP